MGVFASQGHPPLRFRNRARHDEGLEDSGSRRGFRALRGNADKYKKDHDDIQEKAQEFEKDRDHKGDQALRLEISEVFLEVAIVFASLAILSKRPLVWYLSMLQQYVIGSSRLTCRSIAERAQIMKTEVSQFCDFLFL